jgi:hypothetical protein
MNAPARLNPRDRDAIIQALMAGVVPKLGLPHVQVGRGLEVSALVKDVARIADGGAAVRFVIGEYGAGKTFFLNLVNLVALEKKCVTIKADLAPDRRIHATSGQARSLYAEAVKNMATRTKPEGGALPNVVEKFVGECMKMSQADGTPVDQLIARKLAPLEEYVGGYDFVTVVKAYWKASDAGNEDGKSAALRWIRGEYTTKTDAREALGVRTIIDDSNVYDSLKLLAAFVRLADYSGLVVIFDEMVNIYKLTNSQSRSSNYEQLLRIVNDVLQGSAQNIGFVFGGTPEFLMDTRRGVYSYEALRSRLQENSFADKGVVDVAGPVVRLQSLSQEELLLLLQKVRAIFAVGMDRELISDDGLIAFMTHCYKKVGESYFRTPRNTVKAFVQLLSVLEQNPQIDWQSRLGHIDVVKDDGRATDEVLETADGDDGLTSFQL